MKDFDDIKIHGTTIKIKNHKNSGDRVQLFAQSSFSFQNDLTSSMLTLMQQ
jgi:hypothetical protein